MIAEPEYKQRNRIRFRQSLADLLREILPAAIPQKKLPLLDWAEAKLRYPTGRRRGQRFNRRHQPATSLFLELFDDPRWRRVMLVGPNQAGKSFSLVTVVLNALDNWREDVIFGLPDLDKMFAAKWAKDFKPILDNSTLRDLLPETGRGTRGGTPSLMQLTNGRTLQAMGAGAGDSQRASSTSRIVCVTEFKDFGTTAKASDEGTKAQQLINRTRQYQGEELFFAESTLTIAENCAWQAYLSGTQTLVHFECPHCGVHIAPEREHLVGWQDAQTEDEARINGRFQCPVCEQTMEESERKAALQNAVALHKGQTVVDGQIVGDIPPTASLSFRFSASSNMFADAGAIAAEEWACANLEDRVKQDQADRTLLQSIYAWPAASESLHLGALDGMRLMKRTNATDFGNVPKGTYLLTGGCDVRGKWLHASVVAWREDAGPVLIWWGSEPIREGMLWKTALKQAGRVLQKKFSTEFELPVLFTLLDAHWKTEECDELAAMDFTWQSCMGFGAGVLRDKSYRSPKQTGNTCRYIGDGYHLALVGGRDLVELDATRHKLNLLELLELDPEDPNALTFANAEPAAMKWLVDHLTAEVPKPKTDAGESVTIFEELRNEQHLLDATSYAVAAKQVYDDLQDMLQPEEIDYEPEVIAGGVW